MQPGPCAVAGPAAVRELYGAVSGTAAAWTGSAGGAQSCGPSGGLRGGGGRPSAWEWPGCPSPARSVSSAAPPVCGGLGSGGRRVCVCVSGRGCVGAGRRWGRVGHPVYVCVSVCGARHVSALCPERGHSAILPLGGSSQPFLRVRCFLSQVCSRAVQAMIEVLAKLGRGPVFLAGEVLECVITFTNPLSASSTSASRYCSLSGKPRSGRADLVPPGVPSPRGSSSPSLLNSHM